MKVTKNVLSPEQKKKTFEIAQFWQKVWRNDLDTEGKKRKSEKENSKS